MKRKTRMIRHGLLLLAGTLGMSGAALAQSFQMRPPENPSDATAQIIGGQPATPGDWPATLRFDTPDGMCTSTVVGPRVVLTAAHCVDNGATGDVVLGTQPTSVTCDHHPGYDEDYRLDIALCLAVSDITLPGNPANRRFETLNIDSLAPAVADPADPDDTVTLIGFGCRRVGGGGPSGVLYQGQSRVRTAADDDAYVETRGGAAVCFGDSGGGAFLRERGSGPRRLFGINSRGDIRTRSLLTAVAYPLVDRFVRDWKATKQVQICGIDALPSCR